MKQSLIEPRKAATPLEAGAAASAGQQRASSPDGKAWTLDVRTTERESFIEYHLTGTVSRGGQAIDDLLARVAGILAEQRVEAIQEKFYGRCGARTGVLQRREAAYRREEVDFSVPVTWIEGTPPDGNDFGGLQIWGIVPRVPKTGVTTISAAGGSGRLVTGRGFRMLHLASIRGTAPDGALADGAPAQADRMFANAGAALEASGMSYRHVARTWIYVARLLDWYGDFNRVRTAHYQPAGFSATGPLAFPASTGI